MLPLKLASFVVALAAIVIIGPLALAHRSPEELRQATLSQSPNMACAFDEIPLVIGFETDVPNFWYNFFIQELVVFLIFGTCLIAALNAVCIWLIQRHRQVMSRRSYEMNVMFYKTLTVQMVSFL